jgi:hypothetical protein
MKLQRDRQECRFLWAPRKVEKRLERKAERKVEKKRERLRKRVKRASFEGFREEGG